MTGVHWSPPEDPRGLLGLEHAGHFSDLVKLRGFYRYDAPRTVAQYSVPANPFGWCLHICFHYAIVEISGARREGSAEVEETWRVEVVKGSVAWLSTPDPVWTLVAYKVTEECAVWKGV